MSEGTRRRHGVACCIGVVFLAVVLLGCQTEDRGASDGSWFGEKTPENAIGSLRLGSELLTFNSVFSAKVAGTATDISQRTTSSVVRVATLNWKLQVIPAMQSAVNDPDARRAFLGAWMICTAQRKYLTSDRGSSVFGDQQALAVEAATYLEERFLKIAREFLDDDAIAAAHAEVDRLLDEEGVAAFVVEGEIDLAYAEDQESLGAILGLPLAPLRGMEGIGNTPAEVRRLAQVANSAVARANDMPERIRWQAQLFATELQASPAFVETRASLDRVSRAAESMAETAKSLAATAERLPAELRTELEATIDALEQSQGQLQQTLAEAISLTTDVHEALKTTNETATKVHEISVQATDAATAWEATAAAANALLGTVQEIRGEPTDEDREPFEFKDVVTVAEDLRVSVTDLRAMLIDIDSGKLAGAIGNVQGAADESIDTAMVRANELVNTITVRAFVLLGVFFVGLILYRVVAVKMIRPAT